MISLGSSMLGDGLGVGVPSAGGVGDGVAAAGRLAFQAFTLPSKRLMEMSVVRKSAVEKTRRVRFIFESRIIYSLDWASRSSRHAREPLDAVNRVAGLP